MQKKIISRNTKYLPFAADKSLSKLGNDSRLMLWDLHNYPMGVAVACIRFGAKFLKAGTSEFIIVGRGKHQRSVRAKNLKEELLTCSHLGNVIMKEDTLNPGVLQMTIT